MGTYLNSLNSLNSYSLRVSIICEGVYCSSSFFSKYLNNPELEKKIYLHSISTILTYIIINDIKLEKYIISDIYENKQYNIKVITLCIFASNRFLRLIMRAKYKISNYVYKYFKVFSKQ